MSELRQGTSVKVKIGPFVDSADALSPETGIVLTGAGAADQAELLKHDAAATVDISARTWAAITDSDGWYNLTLTTGDTDTLGELTVVVQDATVCLPVFVRFTVVAQQYWDSKYGTDKLQVHTAEITAGLLANASFNADVGTTAYATNVIALAADKALLEQNLDHLAKAAVDTNLATTVHDNSVLGYTLAKANVSNFARTTDSLEAGGTPITNSATNVINQDVT
jgi:hypothetical protein